ncbi:MAG TPA: hypothetical protein VGJ20_46505 [Xanthobacteraceae bacterium]|jgi:hypothetical protein
MNSVVGQTVATGCPRWDRAPAKAGCLSPTDENGLDELIAKTESGDRAGLANGQPPCVGLAIVLVPTGFLGPTPPATGWNRHRAHHRRHRLTRKYIART